MASQDARLSMFEADFKQQQSEMTNKIDTVLKAITDGITEALPNDTVKNLKLNVNSTSPVLSARSYPMEDPQCSSHPLDSINADPETPLLVARGFLATTNAVIDCRKAIIAVGEGITISIFDVKEIELGKEEAPYLTTLGKRESYKPRPSSDGVGARTPYYAKKEFMDCHLPSADIAKISRKQLKPGKHEHGNGRAHKEPGECYQKSIMLNSS
ncbi:hypothetical protein Tco_1159540 [Tanacetum coccineum]